MSKGSISKKKFRRLKKRKEEGIIYTFGKTASTGEWSIYAGQLTPFLRC